MGNFQNCQLDNKKLKYGNLKFNGSLTSSFSARSVGSQNMYSTKHTRHSDTKFITSGKSRKIHCLKDSCLQDVLSSKKQVRHRRISSYDAEIHSQVRHRRTSSYDAAIHSQCVNEYPTRTKKPFHHLGIETLMSNVQLAPLKH